MSRERLTEPEKARLARAYTHSFHALTQAVEDIITERLGGVPDIPTPKEDDV